MRILLKKKAAQIELDGIIDENLKVRTNLMDAADFWGDWFTGMNERFLNSSAWKLMLVSTLEKLDKEHDIAMMQGKLAVEVIPNTVHNLHEDAPS